MLKNILKLKKTTFRNSTMVESISHKQEHLNFANEVEEFKKRVEQGEKVLDSEILHFILCWFINHVLFTDKKHTKCFNENGLKLVISTKGNIYN